MSAKKRDEAWAWAYAVKLLSYRPRSEAELRERLKAKGCPPEVISQAVYRLREAGLVDDVVVARLFAEDRLLSRPRSRRLLLRELVAKGIPPELARRASQEALPELDERTLAARALEGKRGLWQGLPEEKRIRRAYAFLLRRGFEPGLAREVVKQVFGEGGPGDERE